MSAATATFTIADLERMPDDGMHRELLHGELIELPPPKLHQSRIAMGLVASLLSYLDDHADIGEVWAEGGFQLDAASWLQPDVAVLKPEQLAVSNSDYASGAPLVALEVISPSESGADIEAKSIAYLQTGARAVVWIYPQTRTVHILGEGERRLNNKDTLELPTILPGWSLPVSDLFPDMGLKS